MLTILLYILCAVVTLFILLLVVGYFVLIGRPVYCKSRASMNGKVVLITGILVFFYKNVLRRTKHNFT